MIPPAGCVDPRLWTQANELAMSHISHNGLCILCGTAAPCRILDAAQEAMRRAMASPVVEESDAPPQPPVPEPSVQRARPVGARFRYVASDEPETAEQPPATSTSAPLPGVEGAGYGPTGEAPTGVDAGAEPAAPIGARFWRENRVGKRRRSD